MSIQNYQNRQIDDKTKKTLIILGIIVIFLMFVSSMVDNSNDSNKEDKNSTTSEFTYHQNNVDILKNTIKSDIASDVIMALENTASISKNYKMVEEDVIAYANNEYEIYIEVLVRLIISDRNIKIYIFENQFDVNTATLLYDSANPNAIKTLSDEERENFRKLQREYIVDSTIQIMPSTGVLLHNALGNTQFSFTIKNVSKYDIGNVTLKIAPGYMGYHSNSKAGSYTTYESITSGASKEYTLTPKNWTDYDLFTITEVIVYFNDGTAIKFDEYDCKFLN